MFLPPVLPGPLLPPKLCASDSALFLNIHLFQEANSNCWKWMRGINNKHPSVQCQQVSRGFVGGGSAGRSSWIFPGASSPRQTWAQHSALPLLCDLGQGPWFPWTSVSLSVKWELIIPLPC